jgi:hypothetical protein
MSGPQGPNRRAVTSIKNSARTPGIFKFPMLNVRIFSKTLRVSRTIVSPQGRIPLVSFDGFFNHEKIAQLISTRKASLFELPEEYSGKEVGIVLHRCNPNYPDLFDLGLIFDLKGEGQPLLAFFETSKQSPKQCIFIRRSARLKGGGLSAGYFRLVTKDGQKFFQLDLPTGELDFDFLRGSLPESLLETKGKTVMSELGLLFSISPTGTIKSVDITDNRGQLANLPAERLLPFDFSKTECSSQSGVWFPNASATLSVKDLEIRFGLIYLRVIRDLLVRGNGQEAFDVWANRSQIAKEKILLNLTDTEFRSWFTLLWKNADSKEEAMTLLKHLKLEEMLNFVHDYLLMSGFEADLMLEMLGNNEQEIRSWNQRLDIGNVEHVIVFLKILPQEHATDASLLLADAELPREQELRIVKEMKGKFPMLGTMFGSIIEEFSSSDEFPDEL